MTSLYIAILTCALVGALCNFAAYQLILNVQKKDLARLAKERADLEKLRDSAVEQAKDRAWALTEYHAKSSKLINFTLQILRESSHGSIEHHRQTYARHVQSYEDSYTYLYEVLDLNPTPPYTIKFDDIRFD